MKSSWHKEPWAWFIFFLPFSAVVAGISTYFIANNEADPLVVGDYYKKGKAINLELSKIKLAQKLGIKFELKMSDDELIIKPTGIEKIFPILNLYFYHPTQEEKDFYLILTPDGNGYFRYKFSSINEQQTDEMAKPTISGKWRITLTPFEDNWKIQNSIYLPQNDFIEIYPDITQAN